MRFARPLMLIWIFVLALTPGIGWGAPVDAFHGALQDAYGHYREAVFYLKRSNAMSAAFELETFQEKWKALRKSFGATPPSPYEKDTKWPGTLDAVSAALDKGLALATDGEAKAARDALLPIRSLLADMRRRNGVALFGDYVERANVAFASLFHYRRNPPNFADAAVVTDLKTKLAASIAAYKTCREKAPAVIAGQDQFRRLIDDTLFYLDRMHLAIAEKNQLNVVNILRRVVSSDEILWLRFG